MLKANTNYFDNIKTEAQAYILGYLLADGSITKNRLYISSIDKDRVDFIKSELESEHKLRKESNKGGYDNAKPIYRLTIERKNAWTNLYAYKKDSNNLTIPNLKPELIRHFVRGFFDGDGSVYHWINQGKTLKKYSYYNTKAGRVKKLLPEEQWKVQEYAMLRGECTIIACDSMIKELSTLYTTLDIKHRFKKSTSDLVSYIVVTNKKDITKLYDYIYKDANYYLQRKKDKFEEILNNVGGYSKTYSYVKV